jgi:hypothetical protein
LRQTEGLLESLARLLDLDIPIPDHTTLSRRSRDLKPAMFRRMPGEAVSILVDSTGLKISGTGEWEETKHGLSRRRCWKKLHLAIDESNGEILAATLTTHLEDDASQVGPLLDQIDGKIDSVIADAAYDTRAVYSQLEREGITGIFPPRRDAVLSSDAETSPTTRDRNILMIQKKGRMAWQKETGYQRRSMVENGMFRYKKIIGAAILNRMNGLGSLVSVKKYKLDKQGMLRPKKRLMHQRRRIRSCSLDGNYCTDSITYRRKTDEQRLDIGDGRDWVYRRTISPHIA